MEKDDIKKVFQEIELDKDSSQTNLNTLLSYSAADISLPKQKPTQRFVKYVIAVCFALIVVISTTPQVSAALYSAYQFIIGRGITYTEEEQKPFYYLKKPVIIDEDNGLTLDFLLIYNKTMYILASGAPMNSISFAYGNSKQTNTTDTPQAVWTLQTTDMDPILVNDNSINVKINEIPLTLQLEPIPSYTKEEYEDMDQYQYNDLNMVILPYENEKYYVYGISAQSPKFIQCGIALNNPEISDINGNKVEYTNFQNIYLISKKEQGPFEITSNGYGYHWSQFLFSPNRIKQAVSDKILESGIIQLPSANSTLDKKQQLQLSGFDINIQSVTREENRIIIRYSPHHKDYDTFYLFLDSFSDLSGNNQSVSSADEGGSFEWIINADSYYSNNELEVVLGYYTIIIDGVAIDLELPVD